MKKNYLQLPHTSIALMVFVFIVVLFFLGCNDVDNVSPLYNKTFSNVAVPEIVSVSPADSAFAGADEITITGHNFAASKSEIAVFFNTSPAAIISTDTNKIVVKAPNLVKDTITIKISKFTAEKISNSVTYKLISTTKTIKEFSTGLRPFALTLDKFGNIYYSSTSSDVSDGITKISADGVVSNYALKGGETKYNGLKFYKADTLFGSRSVKAIFKIAQGKAPVTFVTGFSKEVADFDVDANGNIWAIGTQDVIFRVQKETYLKKNFPTSGIFNACRIYNDYLYVSGKKSLSDPSQIVWRYPIINSDSLGSQEVYFNLTNANLTPSDNLNSVAIYAITFSNDGDLYIATDAMDPIVIVKSSKEVSALFPGVLNAVGRNKIVNFWWDEIYLYCIRQTAEFDPALIEKPLSEAIIRVNAKKTGAPYFGNN